MISPDIPWRKHMAGRSDLAECEGRECCGTQSCIEVPADPLGIRFSVGIGSWILYKRTYSIYIYIYHDNYDTIWYAMIWYDIIVYIYTFHTDMFVWECIVFYIYICKSWANRLQVDTLRGKSNEAFLPNSDNPQLILTEIVWRSICYILLVYLMYIYCS